MIFWSWLFHFIVFNVEGFSFSFYTFAHLNRPLVGYLSVQSNSCQAHFECAKVYNRRRPSLSLTMVLDPNVQTIIRYKSFLNKQSINELLQNIDSHQFQDVYINKGYGEVVGIDVSSKGEPLDIFDYHLAVDIDPLLSQKIVDKAYENHIAIHFADFNPPNPVWAFISHAPDYIIPFLVISFFINILFSVLSNFIRGSGGPNQGSRNGLGPFGSFPFQNQFKVQSTRPNVTLDSWAGSPEVKEEVQEVISYQFNKELYQSVGAEMPKGILLEGPPGTGKTMIAKAIATETESHFISVSSSEFVEIFVGVGAQKVRQLFEEARRNKPCVIFIDEIDAVGKQRGGAGFRSNGNDEQEQTLNQLLFEMDGFNDNEDLLVLAATNRKEVLDTALLRPGRFDRIIKVPLPDKFSREKILENYLRGKKVDESVNIGLLAELTNGYSGADIKNMVNEAAIFTAKSNSTVLQEQALLYAIEKSLVGLIKKNYTAPYDVRARVAYHESGHAILAYLFPYYFDLQKVSIQATYNGAGGYTVFQEKPEIQEGGLYTKDILKKRLIVSLGGKAAETIIYGDEYVSLGAREDLKQANSLAGQMINSFGMGRELEVFSANEEKQFRNVYSESIKTVIDEESLELVADAFYEAKELLEKHREFLVAFSHLLMNQTQLYRPDMQKVFTQYQMNSTRR